MRTILSLALPLVLMLGGGERAAAQEAGEPQSPGRPGVTRPADPQQGPPGVSPAGGAGGGRSAAPT
jgi:hypothetical protein